MSESTSTPRPSGVDHGVSVCPVQMQAGKSFRAECMCGWTSTIVPTRLEAAGAGQAHLEPTLVVPLNAPDPFMSVCPPWCELADQGEHKMTFHHDDRIHWGISVHVPLSHCRATYESESRTYSLAYMAFGLRQHTDQAEPHVNVGLDSIGGPEFTLSLCEAEQIGRALLAMVEAAR